MSEEREVSLSGNFSQSKQSGAPVQNGVKVLIAPSLTLIENIVTFPDKRKPEVVASGLDGAMNVPPILSYECLSASGNFFCCEDGGRLSNNFTKIPKSLTSHPAWRSAKIKHRIIFLHFLETAAWAPTFFYWEGKKHELAKGELYLSTRRLATFLSYDHEDLEDSITHADVRGTIRYFLRVNFLTQRLTQRVTILSIRFSEFCEFDYDSPNTTSNTRLTQPSHTKEDVIDLKDKKKSRGSAAPVATADGLRLSSLLLETLKKAKPDFMPKNSKSWAIEIDRMIRLDDRDPGRIQLAIERLPSCWWAQACFSAASLRENFDAIESSQKQSDSKVHVPRETASEVLEKGIKPGYTWKSEYGLAKIYASTGYEVATHSTADVNELKRWLEKERFGKKIS